MNNLLIFCANLHGGGSAAVATSFISNLSKLELKGFNIDLHVSTYVMNNLLSHNADLSMISEVKVYDVYGIKAMWQIRGRVSKFYDIAFVIFGPLYYLPKLAKKVVVGFAQPAIVYPDRIRYFEDSFFKIFLLKCKYLIQKLFFRGSDCLVVELDHVKTGLLSQFLFKNADIRVVHSAFDDIYQRRMDWLPVIVKKSNAQKIGLISRNYPHKNLSILPVVKDILLKEYNLNCDFYVTFSDSEWADCSDYFRSSVFNVGSLQLAQCPSFYEQMDAVVFPTLLECFSAVPLEAMYMRKKLFASDLPFIRDCAGEFAFYFNPLDPEDIARCISENIDFSDDVFYDAAFERAIFFGTGKRRAADYFELIKFECSGFSN